MFPKFVCNHSLRLRCLFNNEIHFKRYLISNDSKLIEYRFNKVCVWSGVRPFGRPFSHKTDSELNKSFDETKLKTIENQNPLKLTAKEIPKRSEFFYIILKKPNELIEWIEKTPKEKKKNVIFSAIIKYLLKPLGVISLFSLVFILVNGDVNPLTGRDCVYAIPEEMAKEIEKDVFDEIFTQNMKSNSFLPSTDPLVKRLDNCFERLIKSNNDLDVIGDGIWTPVVIKDDRICDVIVLKEERNVFVYKNMLDFCETDDELAYVLAHQLSHAMLDHKREPTAYASIIFAPFLAFLPKLWLLGKDPIFRLDITKDLDTFLENRVKGFVRKTISWSPYTDDFEEEADRIAMQLMTRACFDIRKCRQFCQKYKHLNEKEFRSKNKDKDYKFFEMHPISDEKLLYLFQYIKPFIELRKLCECQPLV